MRVGAFIGVFVAIVIYNTDRYDIVGPTNTPVLSIIYGWPLTCVSGTIGREDASYSTGAFQFWRSTSNVVLAPVGAVTNLCVALVVAFACSDAFAWFSTRLDARINIASMLGATAFAAFFISSLMYQQGFAVEDLSGFHSRFLTWYLFEYLERFVWLCLFVCCVWIPNKCWYTIRHGQLSQKNRQDT